MKIYIACALTHVPRNHFSEYVEFVHSAAASLRIAGHDPLYALVNSDPQLASKPLNDRAKLCYRWDREMVEASDILIAEASFPSIGLGIEMQIAEHCGIPTILAFRDYGENHASPVKYENPDHSTHDLQIGDGFVTLMALGIPSIFRVIRYNSSEDGIERIGAAVKLLEREPR